MTKPTPEQVQQWVIEGVDSQMGTADYIAQQAYAAGAASMQSSIVEWKMKFVAMEDERDALRAQEPVAWRYTFKTKVVRIEQQRLDFYHWEDGDWIKGEPLYAAAPAPQPVNQMLVGKNRHISYVCPQCYWSLEPQEPVNQMLLESLKVAVESDLGSRWIWHVTAKETWMKNARAAIAAAEGETK
jgi:hypothetical protein